MHFITSAFIVIFMTMFSPFANHGLYAKTSNTDIANQGTHKQVDKHSNQTLLFFNNNRLNLSGITLISLLADLGMRDFPSLTQNETDNISQTDAYLIQAMQSISSKSNFSTNIQLHYDTAYLYIDALVPQFNTVIRLRQAINRYKRMLSISWPALSPEFTPRLGQGHQQVIVLRRKLDTLGDLPKINTSKHRQHIFDKDLISALKRFQQRHGYKQTGELNNQTLLALNKGFESKVKTLQGNLWRLLSLPTHQPTKYIIVNIPSYELKLIEHGIQRLQMKVIVGTKDNQTPTMLTSLSSVTINPTWTPTRNITYNELLPLHNKNRNTLKSRNFQLAKGYGNQTSYIDIPYELSPMLNEYRLVQLPGRNNALGKIRFNIHNNQAIYLHDTPTKQLFNKRYRALSHGCIRLQQPQVLLNKLVTNQKAITPHMNQGTFNLYLNQRTDVFITYQTAWVDRKSIVHWRDDLYGKD